jgi:small neutral amino acid transporter SnatA (MarC family)
VTTDLEARREAYERGFRRAGLPLFIEDYSATSDIFTRAVPFLGVVFGLQVLNGIDPDWPLLANLAAVAGGLAILLAAVGLLNRSHGRRFWSVPERVGRRELAGFVIIPALLPLIFGGHAALALAAVIQNLVVLGLVYVVVGYGVLSILRWTGRRVVRQLAAPPCSWHARCRCCW